MRSSRILAAAVAAATGLAMTLLISLEDFGVLGHGATPTAPSKREAALQRVADEGDDQGDGDTEDPPLQPSEQQEEQQEEQQGPGRDAEFS
jgi:hypothetical protein